MRRILVISLAGIGDTLMATPLIHELKLQFPDASVEAFVFWKGAREILEGNPHLDAVHQHDFLRSGRFDSLRVVGGLRRRRFDLSINTHTQGRRSYRLVARAIGARLRLSHEYENQCWMDRCLVNRSLPQDYTVHCIENNQRLLGLIGLRPILKNPEYELFVTPEEQAWAGAWEAKNGLAGRRWLGVHAGSGGTKNLALRRWPIENYVALVRELESRCAGFRAVFFGGPEERKAHEEVRRALGGSFLAAETPSLRHAAALVGLAHAFVSVDTLFMHLAAARKVARQFVIETPTVNPPILPHRRDWVLIPNPAVHGRTLDYYRFDGRDIRGSADELRRIMESVSVESVCSAVASAF